MSKSKIEWCDRTWSPVTGCTKISSGCVNCYAERQAIMHRGHPNPKIAHTYRNGFEVTCHPEKLQQPIPWRNPSRVFVCSMSDLFHEDVPDEFIVKVWATMAQAWKQTFLILTKRSERLRNLLADCAQFYADVIYELQDRGLEFDDLLWPLLNVHVGVSCSTQGELEKASEDLMMTDAVLWFLSLEPLLEEIILPYSLTDDAVCPECGSTGRKQTCTFCGADTEPRQRIEHVIVGCESGPGRRPMMFGWAASLRDQCQESGIPFFLKQVEVRRKIIKMPAMGGRVWDQLPEARP